MSGRLRSTSLREEVAAAAGLSIAARSEPTLSTIINSIQ
jgi:hypothetical protein